MKHTDEEAVTMRMMGLDVGNKRVGVAISDELGWTAQGLTVLSREPMTRLMSELDALVEQYTVAEIVVGMPKNMDGTIGQRGREVEDFANELRHYFHLPVTLWDERLTTVAAEKSLLEADLSRKKRKKLVDKVAAALILEGYMQARGAQNDGTT